MSKTIARQNHGYAISSFAIFLLSGLTFQGLPAAAQSPNHPMPAVGVDASPYSFLAPAPAPAEAADLPDAPVPAVEDANARQEESTSLPGNLDFSMPGAEPPGTGLSTGLAGRVPLNQCPYDTTRARECRVHWHQLIITSSVFNAFQNGGNLYTSYWYRYETTTGKWFDRWFNSDLGWHWDRWDDGNPFLDKYVGHPMMGGITNSIWIQNDPKGMTVEFSNTREYWHSRLRALAFSTAYSFEWKFGPFGEAGIGHSGDHNTEKINGVLQNGTGDAELITTPFGGFGWTIAEDYLDKHLVRKLEEKPRGPFGLLAISFLTPARATANIFRFRPPWYRDGREVKARSFFSEPLGPDETVAPDSPPESSSASSNSGSVSGVGGEAAAVQSAHRYGVLPVWPHYGGVHEVGAWWGLSLVAGHIWGYASDIRYMPMDVNYSYLFHRGDKWNLRWSPELNVAMLDEPLTAPTTNPKMHRKRTYGGGLSPVGFRASFLPEKRVQPFFSTNGGALYFGDRVLSPQGSQFMFTIDFGGGLTIYRKPRQSVSLGYRYQHISNANISLHNPGTDANTFYVQIARFRTKGYR